MGKVDLDNGYTRIANELLEIIPRLGFNGTQLSILIVVIRYTYGFQRKEHELSLSFLAKATKKHKMHIQKEIKNLIQMNILKELSVPTFNSSRVIGLNKDINSWELVKTLTVSDLDRVSQNSNTTVSELTNATVSELTNQERKDKENIKERSAFFEKVWKEYPNKKGKGKVSDTKKKELYKLGEELLRAIERYKSDKPDWQNWQNGSTFFNSGYLDYLDDEYVKPNKEVSNNNNYVRMEEII